MEVKFFGSPSFLEQRRRRRQREREKNNRFRLAKQQLCTCITLFYISWPLLHKCYMKLPSFMLSLYKVGEHNTKIFFFFFKTLEFNARKFRQYLTNLKWNWIRSMNGVWNSVNSRFRFVVIQTFCYHGNVTQRLLLSILSNNYNVGGSLRSRRWKG